MSQMWLIFSSKTVYPKNKIKKSTNRKFTNHVEKTGVRSQWLLLIRFEYIHKISELYIDDKD